MYTCVLCAVTRRATNSLCALARVCGGCCWHLISCTCRPVLGHLARPNTTNCFVCSCFLALLLYQFAVASLRCGALAGPVRLSCMRVTKERMEGGQVAPWPCVRGAQSPACMRARPSVQKAFNRPSEQNVWRAYVHAGD